MNRTLRFPLCFALVALMVHVASPPTEAEVGVVIHPSGAVSSYILQIIVDEPDPVTIAWSPYHVGNADFLVVNGEGFDNGDQEPSMITVPGSNSPIVAWAKNTPSGFDIALTHFDGTNWGEPQVVAGTPADELDPSLVLNPNDGSIHLFYWVNDGSPRVLHRQAPADLTSWSPPVQVSHSGDIACRPSGVYHDGTLQVVYEVHALGLGTAPREVVHALQNGQTFSSDIVATSQHPGDNQPQIHSASDQLWIDWIDGENDMAWTRQLAGGAWGPIQTEYFGTLEEREFHVRGVIRIHALE